MRATVRGDILCIAAAEISEVGATVRLRIAVQNFTPVAATGHSDPIVMASERSEIENRNDDLVAAARLPHETQHALLRIAAVDPLEPRGIAVQLMQSPFRAICLVQIRHPLLKLSM